tara:strand:+ start:957 stop:1136 length:180 start_codon:yes stop_codon:yes gene_type:complete
MEKPQFDDVELIKKDKGWTLRVVRNDLTDKDSFEQMVRKLANALSEFGITVRFTSTQDV